MLPYTLKGWIGPFTSLFVELSQVISVHLTSCLIHTTLCKISVYMHSSPCPWGLHRCSSSNVHPLCGVCGFSRFTCHSHFFSPPFMDFIVLPHLKYLCLTLLLLFSFLFLHLGELEEEMENPEMRDLPEKQKHQLRHRELFLSRQLESLPATHIRYTSFVSQD